MSLTLLLMPLIAQISLRWGGDSGQNSRPNLDMNPGVAGLRTLPSAKLPAMPAPLRNRLANCLAQAGSAPDDAIETAQTWLAEARGTDRALPHMCLGAAYAGIGRWVEAEGAFVTGRDAAAADDHGLRARLGIMAGNAAIAGGSPISALAELDLAKNDAQAAKAADYLVDIAIDRARTLVLLRRPGEAAEALADARAAAPDDALAWLLSATLSRRENRLAEAQQQIETAARLAPTDPEIGLEAGVIAELAGHEDAARKSWQSVVAADPSGAAGRQAAAYLNEIGPGAAVGPAVPASPQPLSPAPEKERAAEPGR